MFDGFSLSVMGASHERRNIVCQDSSAFKVGNGYAVAVVADGHGSKKHFRSDVGSRFAVEAVLETMEVFFKDPDDFDANFKTGHKRIVRKIEKYVMMLWDRKITEHLAVTKLTNAEKARFKSGELAEIPQVSYYGTTLIAAVMCRGYMFGFQIGDGSLVTVFEDGDTSMIMDYEESNPANITASMCNPNAASMFNSFYVDKKKVLCVCVSTDGLYTSFGSDQDFLDYHTIIAGQLTNVDRFMQSLTNNITKRTKFGTEDDISISCVYNTELAESSLEAVKAKIEENKRVAAMKRANLLKQ